MGTDATSIDILGIAAAFALTIVAMAYGIGQISAFLFLVCILGVTQRGAPVGIAGLAIGLTLIAIHLLGINVTGTSVNPPRSLGPAIVGAASNPHALSQVWLFIIAPLIGAGIAGYLFKSGVLAADDVIPERGAATSDVPPAASAPRKRR